MIQIQLEKKLHFEDGPGRLSLDLSIDPGSFITVFGKSGAGKTTLLRCLAGLTKPDTGKITFGETIWLDTDTNYCVPTQKRNIGFVFQDFALFPHLTVWENTVFAAKTSDDKHRADYLFSLLDLKSLSHQKPDQLSGGQKQRVAFARALVRKPALLLLDEPLSAIDAETRIRLQDALLIMHKEFNLTTLMISHDVGEAFRLSDKILVLAQGKIQKSGTPAQVFAEGSISGKFKFSGKLLTIKKEDVVYILSILVGTNILKIIASAEEIKELKEGDDVIIASKAFNPVVFKA
jgi:molybdate transport system ATP-binding protein